MSNSIHSTCQQLAQQWSQALNELNSSNDQDLAGKMAAMAIQTKQDDLWAKEDSPEPLLHHITNLLFDLELPQGDQPWRDHSWQEVRDLVSQLQAKYP